MSNPQYYYVPVQYQPAQYQPQFLQVIVEGLVVVAMIVMLGGFVVTQVRKVVKGEEVEFPLIH